MSFSATWEYGGAVSWIELRLSPVAQDRTRLELEHTAHVDDELWDQFGPGATGVGWDLALIGLDQYLTADEPMDPKAAVAWGASDEGRRFMSLSSERWGDASIAVGTDPEHARAAAARTTAFYTAPPSGETS